jgi:ABC-2 type transport system permease protein
MRTTRLAAFEWRLLTADRTPWLLALVFGAIIAYGAWNGTAWAAFQQSTIAAVQLEETERLAKLGERMGRMASGDTTVTAPIPGVLGAQGATRYAILPPAPLAPLAVGSSDLYPYYARVSMRSKQSFIVNDEIENPHNLLAGRFDLSFAIVFVYPLLILALTYNLVSAEREQGTMALLMSQPTSTRRILLTKLAVRALLVVALTAALLLAVVVGVGVNVAAPGAMAGLSMWVAVVLAYGAFWFGAAVAVNAMGKSSATNALALLGCWLLVVVLIPSLYAAAVTTWYPAPSRVALTTELREVSDRAAAQGDTAVGQFLADHPEMAATGVLSTSNTWGRTIALQERTNDAMRTTYAAFDSALAVQQAVAARFRFFSPAMVVQDALHDVAGRGTQRFRDYDAQLDRYHRAWQAFFFARIFAERPFTAQDFAQLPTFTYREARTGTVAGRVGIALLLVLVPAILIGLWGTRRLERVSVTES